MLHEATQKHTKLSQAVRDLTYAHRAATRLQSRLDRSEPMIRAVTTARKMTDGGD